MALSITEYRCKLINLILFARSEEDIERFIQASIKGLKECGLNGHLILRFVERTVQDLNGFVPGNPDSRQLRNIQTARVQLNRLKGAIQQGNAKPGKAGEAEREPASTKGPR